MENKIDLGNGRIHIILWKLFIPTLVGMLFTALFLIVDGIFVGRGVGPDGLAAVNLFEPFLVLYLGIGTMVGVGCSVQAAMDLSHDNTVNARVCVTRAYIIVLLICLGISAILYSSPHTALTLVGCTSTLEPIATEYYRWFIPSACFIAIQIVFSFVIRLDGSPRFVMITNIVPNFINIVLDYIFIFKLGMGMRGAAMATNIGTGIGILMSTYYIFFLSNELKLCRNILMKGTGRILKLGSPSFVSEFSCGTVSLFGNIMFGQYLKDTGIAAFSIICYLTPIIYTIFIALASSMQPIVSFNYGCGKISRVKTTLILSIATSTVCAIIAGITVYVFSDQIASIFLEPGIDAHILACSGLELFSIAYLFSGVNIIIITFMQSMEKIRQSMLLTILRSFVFIAVAFTVAPRIIGNSGLWLAVPISEICTFAACIIIFLTNIKKYHER